jgi:all-trans-retinol 13,14-reductase
VDVGRSYRTHELDERYDAIVVGSGISGLATAAVLAKHAGKRVLVLERHFRAGGFTHAFTRRGYEWDVGVHYVGQVGEGGALRAAFDYVTEGRLRWAPLPDVYDRIVIEGRDYDYVSGRRRFVERMTAYFPGEASAIERYLEIVDETARATPRFYLDKTAATARSTRPGARTPVLPHADRTTGEVLSSLTADRELRAVLAGQLGDYGLAPARSSFAAHAAVVSHYLEGAFYPVGGASAIARAIAPVIDRAGGSILVRAEVDAILVERGAAAGVRMGDGREVRAPLVVSAAGAVTTFDRLLRAEVVPAEIRTAIDATGPSVSYAALYLGFAHSDEALGLDGTNLWLYASADHDESFARYGADPDCLFPLVFVSFPSAKDPTFQARHPGRSTVIAIVPTQYDSFSRWKGTRWKRRGSDYALKARMTERILAVVLARLPRLRDKVDHVELSTPLSSAHFSGYTSGELYGLDHTPARYRVPTRLAAPLRGLFVTGQDVVSAGVGACLMAGVLTSSAILGPGPLLAVAAR